MKTIHIIGILTAIALIVFSVCCPLPEKRVRVSYTSGAYDNTWCDEAGAQYMGGDAYNYQIEATLKAGYMSGMLAVKSIVFVGGVLLLFLTAFSFARCTYLKRQIGLFENLCSDKKNLTENNPQ